MNRIARIAGATLCSALLVSAGIGTSISLAQQGPQPGPQPGPQQGPQPGPQQGPQPGPQPGPQQGQPGPQGGPQNLPDCAEGTFPSQANPCKPAGGVDLKPCAEGVNPTPEAPCRPAGTNPQLDQKPPADAMKKLLTLDVDIDGSGEADGSFDATLNRIVKGMSASHRAQFTQQMQDESFVINTNSKTKCFADKKSDPDALADPVSCTVLSDAVDNYANTVKATTQVRMKFDAASFTPTFTATKIVIKGKSKI
jgi:hypothetical protein